MCPRILFVGREMKVGHPPARLGLSDDDRERAALVLAGVDGPLEEPEAGQDGRRFAQEGHGDVAGGEGVPGFLPAGDEAEPLVVLQNAAEVADEPFLVRREIGHIGGEDARDLAQVVGVPESEPVVDE